MKLQSILHLALLIGSWSVVNSKSNSNQSNGNNTKGIIRHQQTFETRLNHLLVDNVAGRVSFPSSTCTLHCGSWFMLSSALSLSLNFFLTSEG